MQCITLLTFFILAMLAVCINGGTVTINGKCINCNRPNENPSTTLSPTTRRSYGGRSYSYQTTPRPRQMGRNPTKDDDDFNMDGWNMYQSADGTQYISGGRGYRW